MSDPLLARFVAMVRDHSSLQLPVVVMSSGVIAEGHLVSEARWLDEMATVLEAGGAGAAAFGSWFREARAHVELAGAVGAGDDQRVHLMKAVLRSGGQLSSVGLWRIELGAVDGWKLGTALPDAQLRAVP